MLQEVNLFLLNLKPFHSRTFNLNENKKLNRKWKSSLPTKKIIETYFYLKKKIFSYQFFSPKRKYLFVQKNTIQLHSLTIRTNLTDLKEK